MAPASRCANSLWSTAMSVTRPALSRASAAPGTSRSTRCAHLRAGARRCAGAWPRPARIRCAARRRRGSAPRRRSRRRWPPPARRSAKGSLQPSGRPVMAITGTPRLAQRMQRRQRRGVEPAVGGERVVDVGQHAGARCRSAGCGSAASGCERRGAHAGCTRRGRGCRLTGIKPAGRRDFSIIDLPRSPTCTAMAKDTAARPPSPRAGSPSRTAPRGARKRRARAAGDRAGPRRGRSMPATCRRRWRSARSNASASRAPPCAPRSSRSRRCPTSSPRTSRAGPGDGTTAGSASCRP